MGNTQLPTQSVSRVNQTGLRAEEASTHITEVKNKWERNATPTNCVPYMCRGRFIFLIAQKPCASDGEEADILVLLVWNSRKH